MNIIRCEITDKKSVITRMWLRLLWCSVGFILSLVFYRWQQELFPLWLVVGPALVVYMAAVGYALDSWRLRHQGDRRRLVFLVALAMLPLLGFVEAYILCNII